MLEAYESRTLKTYLIAAISVVLIAVGFLGCLQYINRKNTNLDIEKTSKIEKYNQQLEQLNSDNIQNVSTIFKDLRGPINGLDYILKSFEEYIEKDDRASVLLTLDLLKGTIRESQTLSHNIAKCAKEKNDSVSGLS